MSGSKSSFLFVHSVYLNLYYLNFTRLQKYLYSNSSPFFKNNELIKTFYRIVISTSTLIRLCHRVIFTTSRVVRLFSKIQFATSSWHYRWRQYNFHNPFSFQDIGENTIFWGTPVSQIFNLFEDVKTDSLKILKIPYTSIQSGTPCTTLHLIITDTQPVT